MSAMTRPAAIGRLIVVAVAALAVGCNPVQPDLTASAMLPNLPDYHMTDTLDIQDAIAKVAGAASLAAAQPQITALIAGVSSLAKCYQEAGAVNGRTYVKKDNPFAAGLVIIVNRNVLLNPVTLLNCIVGGESRMGPAAAMTLQPCANIYTLPKGNNEFYIAYVATNPEVCDTFCAALEGCSQ